MGNDLQKQYNLKEKPIKLPGSYAFLKFVDHPTDLSSSLIIIKSPHKAGIINSQILLPIKQIKNLGYSDYSMATCRKCKPLGLVKPRSQAEMKLIIRQIIKLGCELGRIFLCDGRLMLWCQEIRSNFFRSPEQIQSNKQSEKSKVFWAGVCLVNFLHCVYDKQGKKRKDKKNPEIQSFFDPKDKKQYYEFLDNLQPKLSKSSFWSSVSEGMKNLILVMLAKEQSERIDFKTLMLLPYFSTQKQLRLYHMLSDQMLEWDEKQCIILMQTIEMVIHDRIIFDDLVLNDYLAPILVFLLHKRPQVIISAIVELPNPPTKQIVLAVKKANPKNVRLFNAILLKIQKFHTALDQQQYDAVLSRTAFCSFELPQLFEKLIRVIPFLTKSIKEANYKKQIQFQFFTQFLQNKIIQKPILLLSLKCLIQLINENLISSVTKLFPFTFNPQKYAQQIQINLHILQLYRLMILQIQPHQLINIMMVKLEPYLSNQQMTDQLFINAKKCVDLIMNRLMKARQISEEDQINIQYDYNFFKMDQIQRPAQSDVVAVLRKQAAKSKNQDISWLTQILDKQQPLAQF